MGGVADFAKNAVGSGLGMVTGGLIGPQLMGMGRQGGGQNYQQTQQQMPQVQQREMPQAMTMQQRNSLLQSRMGGYGMPQQVTPLAMRQPMQQQMQRPSWNVNNYNPYQNMVMQRQQQAQPTPYQNMGMFGQFNPFMPRR